MSSSPPLIVADRYRLVAPLGQGGMGRVWRATDVVLHRDVAIKELVPPPGLTPAERQEMRERSLREARAIARLNNINVVRVFDVLRTDADPWIVMEYVASRSLHDVLAADGPFNPVRAAEMGLGVLNALRAAHRAGVVHRDVKPGNVLISADGRVVLTDFGLATVPGDPNVTRTGLVLGSPAYIAPERARDGTAGPAADLWSLGATLYAAVEGASPFARPSAIATLAALATENPPPSRNAGPLKPVLNGLLRKDPAHRINSEEAERLLLRAAGRRSKLTFPMSPTMRRPGVGRERPALGNPSAPIVPGPRPPVAPGRPQGTQGSGNPQGPATPTGPSQGPNRSPIFAPGKAPVGRSDTPARPDTPTRVERPKADAPRLDATRVDGPPIRDNFPGTRQNPPNARQRPPSGPVQGGTVPPGAPQPGTLQPGIAPSGAVPPSDPAYGGGDPSQTSRGGAGFTAADIAAHRRKSAAAEHERSLAAAAGRQQADPTTVVPQAGSKNFADATTVVPNKQAKRPPAADATTVVPPGGLRRPQAPDATTVMPPSGLKPPARRAPAADPTTVVPPSGLKRPPAADPTTVMPSAGRPPRSLPVDATTVMPSAPPADATTVVPPVAGKPPRRKIPVEAAPAVPEPPSTDASEAGTPTSSATTTGTSDSATTSEAGLATSDTSEPGTTAGNSTGTDASEAGTTTDGATDDDTAEPDTAEPDMAMGSAADTDTADDTPETDAATSSAATSSTATSSAADDTEKSDTPESATAQNDADTPEDADASESTDVPVDDRWSTAEEPPAAQVDAPQAPDAQADDQADEAEPTTDGAAAAEAAAAETTTQPENAAQPRPTEADLPQTTLRETQAQAESRPEAPAEATQLAPTWPESPKRRESPAEATQLASTWPESSAEATQLAPKRRESPAEATQLAPTRSESRVEATRMMGTRGTGPDPEDGPSDEISFDGRSTRPAWRSMEYGPSEIRKPSGITVFGTRLTYVQAAVGTGILLVVVLLVVVLAAKAFGGGAGDDSASPGVTKEQVAGSTPSAQASTPASASASTSPSTAASSSGGFTLPAGWKMYTASAGSHAPAFTVPIPSNASISYDGSQIRFKWNNRLLLIDRGDSPLPDPKQDMLDQEANRSGSQYPNYHRISIQTVDYAQSAADWEFTYTTQNGNAQHVVKRDLVANAKAAYIIGWYTTPDDWASAQSDIQAVYQGFKPQS